MPTTIRPSTYETNSSSTHSIIIKKKIDDHYTPEEMKYSFHDIDWAENHKWSKEKYPNGFDGKIKIGAYNLEFGRDNPSVLNSFCEKCYYVISAYSRYNENTRSYVNPKAQEVLDLIKELVPIITEIELPNMTDDDSISWRWKEWTEEEKKELESKPYYGYIPDEGDEQLMRFLEERNISIREFVTNRRYMVWTGSDEMGIQIWELMDSGLIEEDTTEIFD